MTDQDSTTGSTSGPGTSDASNPALGPTKIEIYDEMSPLAKLVVLLIAIVVLAIIIAAFHDAIWHWFEVHTGTVNESGPYYGFWSGFGSDIGEATLVVGVAVAWRHHNCHSRGCPWLGRPVEGTPYVACPKHRAVSLETIYLAHRKAQERTDSKD